MGDLLNIFSGPAQVSLYDSTNNELLLGYLGEDIDIESEDITAGVSDGNKVITGKLVKITCPILQTDDGALLSSLKTRRSYKQTIYVVASGILVKFSNMFVQVTMNRQFKNGEVHKFALTAQTSVAADFESIVNLLGSDGNCNSEVGATGLATGWAQSNIAEYDVEASHLDGGGNQQYLVFDGANEVMYYDVICPLDQIPVKITASAYVQERISSTASFDFGIKTKTNADVVVDTYMDNQSLTADEETRISKTVTFTPGANVAKIAVYFEDNGGAAADIGFDDVQLEFGELTDFTDNETE